MNILDTIKYNKDTQSASFQMVYGNEYNEQAKLFHSTYGHEKFLIITKNTKNSLKPKNERVCRFCGKGFPQVTFKKDAHLVPHLLGNKQLFSDFECDNCNDMFGHYESDLANFIGLARTLTRLSGKKGVPKFKTPKKDFSIWIDKNDNVAYDELEKDKNVIFDKEKNQITFQADSNSYNCLSVYKSLVKIALSLIKDEDLINYQTSIDFLKKTDIKVLNNPLSKIHDYLIPGPYAGFPIFISFKKRKGVLDNLIPSRTFVIYFRNNMIQFSIPFDKLDSKINEPNSKPKIVLLPPLVDQEWIDKYAKPESRYIDLSINEKVKERTETITIQLDNAL